MEDLKEFKDLVGKIITKIEKIEPKYDNDSLRFTLDNGDVYELYHNQDCCESVKLEEIIGDLDSLLNSPITLAEEVSNSGEISWGSCTWTFYKLSTTKDSVTLRWYGESNGYYSESVDFRKVVR